MIPVKAGESVNLIVIAKSINGDAIGYIDNYAVIIKGKPQLRPGDYVNVRILLPKSHFATAELVSVLGKTKV